MIKIDGAILTLSVARSCEQDLKVQHWAVKILNFLHLSSKVLKFVEFKIRSMHSQLVFLLSGAFTPA